MKLKKIFEECSLTKWNLMDFEGFNKAVNKAFAECKLRNRRKNQARKAAKKVPACGFTAGGMADIMAEEMVKAKKCQ